MKKLTALLLALLMLSLCACKSTPIPNNTDATTTSPVPAVAPADGEDLLIDYAAQSISGRVTDEKFVSSMLDFSATLFRLTLDKEQKCSLISPLSAIIALGMVSNGAAGETKAQFETLFGLSVDEVNEYLYTLASSLYDGDGAKMKLANSIWFSDSKNLISVKPEFLQTTKNYYAAQAYKENFSDPVTVGKINGWVSGHTDDMIREIINEMDSNTAMILINALVFDALWREQYLDYSCTDLTFNNYDGTKSTVTGMRSEEGVYISGDGVCGFSKSYQSGYKFIALLPDGDIFDFINSLDGEKLGALLTSSKYAKVRATLPQFEYDYEIEMHNALKEMGLTEAFDGSGVGGADFSGLDENNGVYISRVIHKTHIELTQAGTRAAAVTAVILDTKGAYEENPKYETVVLDRPFVYLIVDSENNVPLFIGAVTEIK